MKEDSTNTGLDYEEISQILDDKVELILAEAEKAIEQIDQSMELIRAIEEVVDATKGDLSRIMPKDSPKAAEREFLDVLSKAAADGEKWMASQNKKPGKSSGKKSVPKRKRGFSV